MNETENEEPTLALSPVEPTNEAKTPAQARVDAVANLLHGAYEKASTLQLTPDEVAALTADFADSDFRTGASGKENLIYIEHASLRERLNKVIGVGQWSLVVRNKWTEIFQYYDKDKSYQDAHRVYVEAVLLIRGCFAGEAIGDMVYYPKNNQTNFGDAVEGAKSAALRRCAKELGVGLQAWHKDFGDGWFKRRAGGDSRRFDPPKAPDKEKTQATPQNAPEGKPAPAKREYTVVQDKRQVTSEDLKVRLLQRLKDERLEVWAWDYMNGIGWITQDQRLEDYPAEKTPRKKDEWEAMHGQLVMLASGPIPEELQAAYDNAHACDQIPGAEIRAGAEKAGKPQSPIPSKEPDPAPAYSGSIGEKRSVEDHWTGQHQQTEASLQPWYSVVITLPRKGMKRDEYLKNPDTIGSLYDASEEDRASQQRLWGLVNKWSVEETWTDKEGNKHHRDDNAIYADRNCRDALDQFKAWHDAKIGDLVP